ncbi:hypothetical protein [Acinetobacter pittii]|uniref:hypothetical protein n=1 Tax=Acinetobacter pittii TaxID=48296 RepID=UPI002AFFF885|nr:hypothetical protein [Acinetobacter pittii]
MSVGLNEIFNLTIFSLLIFALVRLRNETKRTNEINKRLSELEIRIVVRAEDRLTTLEKEVTFKSKADSKTEV